MKLKQQLTILWWL